MNGIKHLLQAEASHWTHDCEDCMFLGQWLAKDGDGEHLHDVYVCPEQPTGPTCILRYGNEGYEYASYPQLVAEQIPGVQGEVIRDAWVAFGRLVSGL